MAIPPVLIPFQYTASDCIENGFGKENGKITLAGGTVPV
jgi:hypothetical protein